MKAKHTPTPWHTGDADFRSILGPTTRRRNDDGRLRLINIATVAQSDDDDEDAANAAIIVRAVNSHVQLMRALEDIAAIKWVATTEEAMRGGNTPMCAAEAMQSIARSALKALNGKAT